MFGEKLTITRAIILVIFLIGAMGGLLVMKFGGSKSSADKEQNYGSVVMWGTIENKKIGTFLSDMQRKKDLIASSLIYRYIPEENFNKELLNAIVDRRQPQLVLLSNKEIWRNKDRLEVFDKNFFSAVDLNNIYVDSASVFSDSYGGAMAVPLFSDPMMMYYNRDIYVTNSLLDAPKTWGELKDVVSRVTSIDDDGNINISGVALGSFKNVSFSKEFMLSLLMQAKIDFSKGILLSANKRNEIVSSILYYALFSKIELGNKYYSWNELLPNSLTLFAASRVATIFAPYSYNKKLRLMNPNLNYRMTEIPYFNNNGLIYKSTYADVYGISVVKGASNRVGAYRMLSRSMNDDFISSISKNVGLIPLKKSLLKNNKDASIRSAIYAKSALIKDDKEINEIFKNMIDNILSERFSINKSIEFANNELKALDNIK